METAGATIRDLNRYTIRFNPEDFTAGVRATYDRLIADGFKPVKFESWTGKPGYRGINTNWDTRDGSVFELQFHAPQSFFAREFNHGLYEEWRMLDPASARAVELTAEMQIVMDSVVMPDGWESLPVL